MSIYSQGKLAKNLKQIPYQYIFVPRSCIRTGLATQFFFTLDIHRKIVNPLNPTGKFFFASDVFV